MQAPSIVEALDVLEERVLDCVNILGNDIGEQLGLDGAECSATALSQQFPFRLMLFEHAEAPNECTVFTCRVRRAAIGVMQEPGRRAMPRDSAFQALLRQC